MLSTGYSSSFGKAYLRQVNQPVVLYIDLPIPSTKHTCNIHPKPSGKRPAPHSLSSSPRLLKPLSRSVLSPAAPKRSAPPAKWSLQSAYNAWSVIWRTMLARKDIQYQMQKKRLERERPFTSSSLKQRQRSPTRKSSSSEYGKKSPGLAAFTCHSLKFRPKRQARRERHDLPCPDLTQS